MAFADHIGKGTRDADLETLIASNVAMRLSVDPWEAFMLLDPEIERIADGGAVRLAGARS